MRTIRLSGVLPQVFAGRGDLESDVWQQDVTFERGKTYLVEADSGTGKSTLCSYLIGYRNDFAGDLLFDGRSSKLMSESEWAELRRRNVSYLFQELRLFPELTARENIDIKNRLTNHLSPAQITAWFDRLGIGDKHDELVGHMSFGQQQRVAMIRALAQPFDFLIADEPISHLDDMNGEVMGQLMQEEAQRQGAAIIVTSIGKHMALPWDRKLNLRKRTDDAL